MTEEINDAKKLSPKERIEKLKQIQEKNKEEIEEAQKLLKEAEDEAEIEEELKDIPIPQLKAVDIEGLFSPEERELFKAKRFESGKKKVDEESEVEDESLQKKTELENIAETAPRLDIAEEQRNVNYIQSLSQKPTEHLYSRTKELYQDFKSQGYLSATQQEEMNNIQYANHKKLDDIEAGKYHEVSKEVANEMVLIERMKNAVQYRK